MTLIVVAAANDALVTWDEAKAHLRLDLDDEKDTVENLITVETERVGGVTGWLNRSLLQQTLELRIDEFPHCRPWEIELPLPPFAELVSVKYDDLDGVEQTLAGTVYRIVGGGLGVSRLALAFGQSWPSTRCQAEAVRIQYKAGYGITPDLVPASIREGIKRLLAQHFNDRGELIRGANPDPANVEVLQPFWLPTIV